MRNAPIKPIGRITNLGRWRPAEDLPKDNRIVLVCGPQFGSGYNLMPADVAPFHHVKFWQPLDPLPYEA